MSRPDAATEALAEAAVGAIGLWILAMVLEPTMDASLRDGLRSEASKKLAAAIKRRGYVIRKARKSG